MMHATRSLSFRCLASCVVLLFTSQQILQAAPAVPILEKEAPQVFQDAARKPDAVSGKVPLTPSLPAPQDFLQDTLVLERAAEPYKSGAAVETVRSESVHEKLERRSFDYAYELLSSGRPAAVIVGDLKPQDLDRLRDLETETAIVVIHGELVLFTSGSQGEIRISPAAEALLEKAAFISHTHPLATQTEGPGMLDLAEAGEQEEFVITDQAVYGYASAGEVRQLSEVEYLSALRRARAVSRSTDLNEAAARGELSRFLLEMDSPAPLAETSLTFRASDPVLFTDNFAVSPLSSNWQSAKGAWVANGGYLSMNYWSSSDRSGVLLVKDGLVQGADLDLEVSVQIADVPSSARGLVARYQDLNNYYYVKMSRASILLVKRVNGSETVLAQKWYSWLTPWVFKKIRLTVEGSQLRVYYDGAAQPLLQIQDSTFASGRFGVMTNADGPRLDDFKATSLNSAPPVMPPVPAALPQYTNQSTLTLSGTKAAGTTLWIDGTDSGVSASATSWSVNRTLTQEGSRTFSILAKDALGNASSTLSLNTVYDVTKPTGTAVLAGGSEYVKSASVVLALTQTETNPDQMRLSWDGGATWSNWTAWSASVNGTLPSSDGLKDVRVEFRDKAGNVSNVLIRDTLTLDTILPQGSVVIAGGAEFTKFLDVSLSVTQTEVNPGRMQFSTDGGTNWSAWQPAAASASLSLPAGDGLKYVRVRFEDLAGNLSTAVMEDQITLDTTPPVIEFKSEAITNQKTYTLVYKVDGVEQSEIKTLTADGDYWFTVTRADAAGNSISKSFTLKLDTVPPVLAVQSTASVTSADYTLQYTVDGTAKTRTEKLVSGANDLMIFEKDAAGNESAMTFRVTYTPVSGGSGTPFSDNFNVSPLISSWQSAKGAWVASGGYLNMNYWSAADRSGVLLVKDGLITGPDVDLEVSVQIADIPSSARGLVVRYQDLNNYYYVKLSRESIQLIKRTNGAETVLAQNWYSWLTPWVFKKIRLTVEGSQLRVYYDGAAQPLLQIQDSTFAAGRFGVMTNADGPRLDDFKATPLNTAPPVTEVILSDGTKMISEAGVLTREVTPQQGELIYALDGSVRYDRNTARKFYYARDGGKGIYIFDAAGSFLEKIEKPKPSSLDETQSLKTVLDGGLEAWYLNGELREIRTSTGIRVTNFTLDAQQNMVDAFLVYPGGRIEVIRQGRLLRRVEADGSIMDFGINGLPVREIFPDGTVSWYATQRNAANAVTQTRVFLDSGEYSIYDELGLLREVRGLAGKKSIYDRTVITGGYHLALNTAASSTPESRTLKSGDYDSQGRPVVLVLQDNTRIEFSSGLVSRVTNAAGEIVNYQFDQAAGGIQGLRVTRAGTEFDYGHDGFLQKVVTSQGALTRRAEDTNHDGTLTDDPIADILLDEVSGGARLTDFELDTDGSILRGIIQTQDGIKQFIENGILTGYETVDGRLYEFGPEAEDGSREAELKEWNFRDGTRIVYGGGDVSQILFPDGSRLDTLGFNASRELETYTQQTPNGTRRVFQGGKLVSLTTQGGVRIEFGRGGMAEKVILSDGTELGVSYHEDAAGGIDEVVFEGDALRRVFSLDGRLRELLAGGVGAQIENDTIQSLYTRYGDVAAPSFDAQGILSGTVNFVDGARQILENGELREMQLPTGTRVHYAQGLIDQVDAAEGTYRIEYTRTSGGLVHGIQLLFSDGTISWSRPLVPYLLANSQSELARLLLSRPLHDALSERENVQTEFENGSEIYFSRLVPDSERDTVYAFGDDYFPEWLGLSLSAAPYDEGYILRHDTLDINDHLPARTAAFVDMNGDGLKDRIMIGSSGTSWKIQFNNGQGFDAPVAWTGVDNTTTWVNGFTQTVGTIRHFAGRHPYVMGDLFDINGDGFPDRILQKYDQSSSWYVQLNNGHGFDPVNIGFGKTIESRGEAYLGSVDGAIGGDALNFDGDTDYLNIQKGPDWDFGSGDFTVEMRFRLEQINQIQELWSQYTGGSTNNNFFLAVGADNRLSAYLEKNGGTWAELISAAAVQASRWYHVALVRQGNTMKLYLDGTAVASAAVSGSAPPLPDWITAGATRGGNTYTYFMKGALDEIRVSKGLARWTSNFTPASEAYARDEFTVFLAHMDTDGGLRDESKRGGGFKNVHPLSSSQPDGQYLSEVREDNGQAKPVQELIADMVDMDGDGLPDRVLRPYVAPFTHWFVQKNLGDGFGDAMLWEGVDTSFDADVKIAGSLSWYMDRTGNVADVSRLADMNGDGRADRVLVKSKIPGNADSPMDWYVQWNNGEGFDAAVLWDNDVRALPGISPAVGTAIHYFKGWYAPRDIMTTLADVTGDGKPDRISVSASNDAAQGSWWVEVNTGSTFAPAVEWTGIYGANEAQSSIGQDAENFRSNDSLGNAGPHDRAPSLVQEVAQLTDINGDAIADRVIFVPGTTRWLVQFGTGTGFLPVQEMTVEGLEVPVTRVVSSRYPYMHVSLKAAQNLPAASGRVHVILENPEKPDTRQEWVITDLTTQWQDFWLPVDGAKPNASQVRVVFEPLGSTTSMPLYVDNVTFTALRPSATKDWLDRLLTEENVLAEIHSERTETLAQYLGYVEDGQEEAPLSTSLLETLLGAEKELHFNPEGTLDQFKNFYGAVAQVEDGRVVQTTLPDGRQIDFSAPDAQHPQSTTQTITQSGGGTQIQQLTYGRVRTVTREGKSPLQYSYEFDASGNEITVVLDPDTSITEGYREINGAARLLSRTDARGVTTEFLYNEKGERTESRIVYKGRVRETFGHGETVEGLATLTTEDGTLEEYDAEGKIRFYTTPDGYRYEHAFEDARDVVVTVQHETATLANGSTATFDVPVVTLENCTSGCERVHRISLKGYTGSAGENAAYENGDLHGLELADGTRLSFEKTGSEEKTDPETGQITSEPRLLDSTVRHADGTITRFRDGLPLEVISATGRVISLAAEQGILINPNESAQFHYQQALKLWNEFVVPKWKAFLAPGSLAVQTEFDMDGKLVTRRFAEGTTEIYEDGQIGMTLGSNGERLVRYDYDAEGNPVRTELEGSRRRLASSALKLRTEVAVENQKALARLADREQLLNQTIEGQYVSQRDRLLAIRAQIEAQYNQVASIRVTGKKAKSMLGGIVSQIQVGIDQVNSALEQLAQSRIQAIEQLGTKVRETSQAITARTQESYARIDTQEGQMRHAILRHELSAVVYHWYRKILGRDASEAEYERWVAAANYEAGTFDLAALKQELLQSPELASRQAEVAAIKQAVADSMTQYLALDADGRAAFAAQLGVATVDQVTLNTSEVNTILTWLQSRSLHFGQSAYLALESLLAAAGIAFQRTELARRLILIDILTGTLTPMEKDDLVISMYALKTVASGYGLAAQGYTMTYEALKAMYDEACAGQGASCGFRAVAHVDGNHYIIITKVMGDEVTYIDPGIGPESALQLKTLSRADFMETWQAARQPQGWGSIFSARAPPTGALASQSRQLTDHEQMAVRGAFFGFLKVLFKFLFYSFLRAFAGGLLLVSYLIKDLRIGIQNFVDSVANIFTDLFTFDFANLFKHDFVEYFKSALNLVGQVLTLPLTVQVMALEKIGLSPKITQTIVAGEKIITGAVLLLVPGAQPAAVGLLTGGTADMLNLHTSLSPATKQLITIGAAAVSAFAGGWTSGGSLSSALTSLKAAAPHLAMDFASSGLVALGDKLGLDPRITSLISTPLRAGVGVGLDSLLHANSVNWNSLGAAIKNGLAAGSKAIGFDFGGASTNPPFGSLSSGAITSSIESALGREGLFSNMFGVLKDALLSPVNFVGGVLKDVMDGVTDFGTLIQQKGVTGAFDQLADSIFSRNTLEAVVKAGGMSGFLGAAAKTSTTFNGQQAEEWKFGSTSGSSGLSLFFNASGALIGKKENGVTQSGTFGFDRLGKWGLTAGNFVAALTGELVFAGEVGDGQFMRGNLSENGSTMATFDPEGGNGTIEIAGPEEPGSKSAGSFWGGVLNFVKQGLSFALKNGTLMQTVANLATQPANTVTVPEGGSAPASYKDRRTYLLNGIGNVNPVEDGAPQYMVNLRNMLRDVYGFSNTALVGLYEGIADFGNQLLNTGVGIFQYVQDFIATTLKPETQKVISKIKDDLSRGLINAGDTINVVAYSGGGQRILEAAWELPIKVNLILYGAPTFVGLIPFNILNVKQVWGTQDWFNRLEPVLGGIKAMGAYNGVLWPTTWMNNVWHTDFPEFDHWGYNCNLPNKCIEGNATYLQHLSKYIVDYFQGMG